MAYYEDLGPCHYFPIVECPLAAIGWLAKGHEFNKGKVDFKFFSKLREFAKNPWQPVASAGFHHCELCQFDPPHFNDNMFIPFQRRIFVAPVGILHYISSHWYCPPTIFCDAVMNCPPMNSMEYKQTLLACGGHNLAKSVILS